MAYIASNKNQNWLLPLNVRDMIPKNHICFLVENFVESLDFTNFDMIYDGAGHPAYHPKILMKILTYGTLCKTRSSRKLAKATKENVVFMYLSEKVNPNFRTINRFRMENPEFVKNAFKKTVELAIKEKIVDLSFISIDGSTLKAYAGSKRYFDKKGLDKLDKAIEKMIEEDIALDELEDELYGKDNANDGLTGMDRKDIKKIVKEFNNSKDKEKIKKNIKKAKNELEKYSLKKVSISDPEARAMQTKKRYSELSYNAQLSVSRNQIIVANDVCQDKHDANQFKPQFKNVKENIKLKKTKVGLDCGFSSAENIKFAEDENIDLYVPSRAQAQKLDGKNETLNHDNYEYDEKRDEIICEGQRYKRSGFYTRKDGRRIWTFYCKELKKKKDVPFYFKERLRMKAKMETDEAKKVYSLRRITVEPVYGNIKENLGFRGFLLRGISKVKTEFNLVCIGHNLQKIWRLMAASGC
jgi:transposase